MPGTAVDAQVIKDAVRLRVGEAPAIEEPAPPTPRQPLNKVLRVRS
jgi:hypothetical protein